MQAQRTPQQRSRSAAGEHALLRRYFAEIGPGSCRERTRRPRRTAARASTALQRTLGLSRERVRQLEHRALARIAAAAREAGLEDWLSTRDFSG